MTTPGKKIPENADVSQGNDRIPDTKENVNAGRPQGDVQEYFSL
jgi:hypothetical protein